MYRPMLAAIGLAGITLGFCGSTAKAEDAVRVLDKVEVVESVKPTIDDYVSLPTFFSARLSPNGKHVAGVRRDGYDYWLVIADLSESPLKWTGTKFEDLEINDVHWATDDRLIVEAFAVFNVRTRAMMTREKWEDPDVSGKFSVGALYGVNRDGSNLIRFFEGDSRMDNIFSSTDLVSLAPFYDDHVLVTQSKNSETDRRTGRDIDGGVQDRVYKLNVNTGDFDEYLRGNSQTVGWETDNTGRVRYRIDTNSIGTKNTYYIRDDDKKKWLKGASVDISNVRDQLRSPFKFDLLGPAEKAPLFFVADVPKGADRKAIYVHNLETGENVEKVAEHPEFDMEDGIFHHRTNELLGVRWEGERPEMILFNPDDRRHAEAVQSYLGDQQSFNLMNISDDGKKWLFYASGPGNPGSYHLYDKDKLAVRDIAVRRAAMAGKAVAVTEIIKYKARDGKELMGYLTVPGGKVTEKNLPVVVYPHGGPQARDNFTFDGMVQLMANEGYAVFQPQFRGSAGWGKKFAESGYREWGGLMQTDVEDGFQHLVKEGIVDGNRACIMGFSYGAYAAAQAGVGTPDAFRCIVAGGGVYDLKQMQKWSKAVRGSQSPTFKYWTRQLGDPVSNHADLVARSPARNVDKIKAPIFLFHGEKDDIVPIEQAEIFERALKSRGHPFEYVVMRKAGHSYGGYRTEEPKEIRQQIIRFLRTHNPA